MHDVVGDIGIDLLTELFDDGKFLEVYVRIICGNFIVKN